ncbi:hypothetical protein [Marinibactrum halimedae]|uniref:Uncharacterized protein n=1 Tax=Marinibactrum halimedae TaxID=1444977 RepID=A0AA37TBN2_9GAMM|nr:hypothetical protein [Marinibactrum halimedae]MCD9460560.1 hypothetical protein [Marinibactrum halimedae]GLS27190.1 hypothetical protein GCM10007877_29090 [Marinibactrum halimedae]
MKSTLLSIIGLATCSLFAHITVGLEYEKLVYLSDGQGNYLELSIDESITHATAHAVEENATGLYLRTSQLGNNTTDNKKRSCFLLEASYKPGYFLMQSPENQSGNLKPISFQWTQTPLESRNIEPSTFCYENGMLHTHDRSSPKPLFFNSDHQYGIGADDDRNWGDSKLQDYHAISLVGLDSYTISASSTSTAPGKKTLLSLSKQEEPVFKEYDFWQQMDHEPLEAEWKFDHVSPPFFTIMNAANHRFLVKDRDSGHLSLVENKALSGKNDGALWRVNMINSTGDFTLINKQVISSNGDIPSYHTLNINLDERVELENGLLEYTAKTQQRSFEAPYDTAFLFNLNERYIPLTLSVEDIVKNNSIMRLANGLPVDNLMIAAARENNISSRRRYKIRIDDRGYDSQYTFIEQINSNLEDVAWEGGRSLEDLVDQLPLASKDSKITSQLVRQQLTENQLTHRYCSTDTKNNSGQMTILTGDRTAKKRAPTIIWLNEGYDPSGTHTQIDQDGKVLRVTLESGEELKKNESFAFLLKKHNPDGGTTHTLFDPSKPAPKPAAAP